ncbi:pyridoxamine 5'-phosphate oxidase [Comamonadaceae bacterium SL12-8]|uniref:Pyridoxamine 5'-phosphate oxidase n=1 Tax=Amphibiibacter pelophylacis TaxID=1799477 RepID=A0ACC6P3F6_9BURK
MIRISELRTDYQMGELDESSAHANPMIQFQTWLDEAIAAGVPEPTAMTLATVDADGQPSTRVVLLKGVDDGLVWYTNQDSRKGREIAANPRVALQFHWVQMERVVRIEGVAQIAESELADAYYHSRPLASRLGAWASPQSQVIAGRDWLQQAWTQAGAEHGEHPQRPPHWGGYRLLPREWEFWQGRRSRLHDRLRYRLDPAAGDGWLRERLAP